MKKSKWKNILLTILLIVCLTGCSDDPVPDNSDTETSVSTETLPNDTTETESSETTPEVPEEWHVFEYDGVKYDFWEISPLVNGVFEWGHIGDHVIAAGHVNPNISVYAVINPETKTIENHFGGSALTCHSDDIRTLVYARWNNVMAYDGTTLASLGLQNGEYIDSIAYTDDKSCIEVRIEGIQNSRTEMINLIPFDAESGFADIPAEWSQRLFWHQIRGSADYMYFFNRRTVNSTLNGYTKDPPKQFSIYHINSTRTDVIGYISAELPSDLAFDTVCPVVVYDGAGSMECEFIVQLTDGDKRFYVSFDNFDREETGDHLQFTCRGILSEERVNELKLTYPEDFAKAEQYFWHYTLKDFQNPPAADSIVYEGYTVEYDIPDPYDTDLIFPFHIHLPQVNADSIYAEKFNLILKNDYEEKFGQYLQNTVYGINREVYANITWEAVTTGDVITIYIIDASGILNSGAARRTYDIYHYDTVQQKFLSTDEFIAYYAEGQFADYTLTDIVNFMNEMVCTTDEMGSPYPLTEQDIKGVIPSVFGEGKFDVVYHGYSMEGSYDTRMLFSPYPTCESADPDTGYPAKYTYRYIYNDLLTCADKEQYNGVPAGYRLFLNKRVEDQYDTGYYTDCLLTQDIADRPESYPESVYGEYYSPVREDMYGHMSVHIDHETDKGHMTAVIPIDPPVTAQDYYRGIVQGYIRFDRILGRNYEVNEDIAAQAAAVLDAYRNGEDPNEMFPASETAYTPYPLENIRENPDAVEIGEILKNAPVNENRIIGFSLDIGEGWVMYLPIGIGGFGESWQAYFTGVTFAHGTPAADTGLHT
ncbi:MAG: hypothetical protein E7658_08620 [Ruminococcaceae bacterium]|nr:hypothetical protein [Oscillospiraceae bacterium]